MSGRRRISYAQIVASCGNNNTICRPPLFSKSTKSIDNNKETIHPLFIAIYNVYYDTVKSELQQLAPNEVDTMSYAGTSPLHASCRVKDIEILKLLLQKGVKVNVINTMGNTPLFTAVGESWTEGICELLRHGASPNSLTGENTKVKGVIHQTPLQVAVSQGNIPIVNILLDSNPNLKLKDSQYNTLLHLAAQSHSSQLIWLLLKREECKMSLKEGNENGNTPLHSLMEAKVSPESEDEVVKCARIFITEGLDVNSTNTYGETALFLACKSNLPQVVKYFLEIGADPTIVTRTEESTLHACCKAGSPTCLKLILLSNKVSNLVLSEDFEGHSPFHNAVNSFSINCCELLLRNGDHLTNKDSQGKTRCSLILMNLPNATELLTRYFDSNTKISSEHIHDPSFNVTFDHSVLFDTSSNCFLQNSFIHELADQRFQTLLNHPLLESFLYIKWCRIKPFFYFGVLNYFIFLLVHTAFLMNTYGRENITDWSLQENRRAYTIFRILYSALFCTNIIPGIILALPQSKKNLLQFETYTKLATLLTASFIIYFPLNDLHPLFQINLASVSIILGWFELLMLLGRFPRFGVYILMFITIMKSIIKFLIAFSSILIGYACAFQILFYEVETFKSLPLTVLKTLMMMVGEIDYGDIYADSNFSLIFRKNEDSFHFHTNDFLRIVLLTSFLFLVPVLMANLLISLAVNDLPDLQRQGKIKRLGKQASYIVSYERLLSFFKRRSWIPRCFLKVLANRYKICCQVTYYPNRKAKDTKNEVQIPSETLREAISVGTKKGDSNDLYTNEKNFEAEFYKFRQQYDKDYKWIANQFSEMKVLHQNSIEKNSSRQDILEILSNIHRELQEQKHTIHKMSSIETQPE